MQQSNRFEIYILRFQIKNWNVTQFTILTAIDWTFYFKINRTRLIDRYIQTESASTNYVHRLHRSRIAVTLHTVVIPFLIIEFLM